MSKSDFTPWDPAKGLGEPLAWATPGALVVVQGDPFDAAVPNERINEVMGVAALAPQLVFLVATSNTRRLYDWQLWLDVARPRWMNVTPNPWQCHLVTYAAEGALGKNFGIDQVPETWPLPNVWVGARVSMQREADERVPELLRAPAARHFLLVEEPTTSVVPQPAWLSGRDVLPRDEYEARQPGGPRVGWVIGRAAAAAGKEQLQLLHRHCAGRVPMYAPSVGLREFPPLGRSAA